MSLITSELVCGAANDVLKSAVPIAITSVVPATDMGADFTGTVATLTFGGAETGTLLVLCPRQVARDLAGVMLGRRSAELSERMVADALGELANQMAGAISRRIKNAGLISLTVPTTATSAHLPALFRNATPVGADIVTASGSIHLRYCAWRERESRGQVHLETAR